MNADIEKARGMADIIRGEFAKQGVGVHTVYLFGSRARGDARPDSDWDFLVFTQNNPERTLRRRMTSEAQWILAGGKVDADILVRPLAELPEVREDIGCVSHAALEEGVAV